MAKQIKCNCVPTIDAEGTHHASTCPMHADNAPQDASGGKAERDELPKKLFATREEAETALKGIANPPKGTKPFEISRKVDDTDTVIGWILAIGYDPAISRAAQVHDGYTASTGARRGGNGKPSEEQIKAAVAAKFAAMTDEELAAMGLTRAKQPKTRR